MAEEPRQIGRYDVEAVLGRGAMGVIYRAHDPVIDRKVAIKLVRADLLDGEARADYIGRFRQEAQAAGRCAHPNIVGIYDFALHEGNPYLAMEYIDGVTLNQVRQTAGTLAVSEAVDIVGQMLDGLGAAHGLGVVHRDIKPANVMLTGRGQVKVTDFGISRLDTSSMTGTGAVLGTPSYMSPEQVRGEAVDGRSDLFSAGVVLYELVTGVRPFAGKSQHEVWNKLLNEAPAAVDGLRAGVPGVVVGVIERALAKRPAERFASAGEMAAALRGRAEAGGQEAGGLQGTVTRTLETDRTVVARSGSGVVLDSAVLGTIERGLARQVGPIASLLMKSAVRQADSVEGLCRTLAERIESAEGRSRFSQEMQVQLAGSMAAASAVGTRAGTALAEADLQRAQAALTKYVGPVSRVLVKRAAPGCADLAQLWTRLAQHVEQPGDRAAFMKLL